MGIQNLYHAIHSAGLSDLLQAGPVAEPDDDHYWSFLDQTYIDDVSGYRVSSCAGLISSIQVQEAMIASRTSVYDHKYYLDMTSPEAIPRDAPPTFRASAAMMHVYIQLPRLVCLIRHASNYPEDTRTLASAIALAESLWSLVPNDLMQEIILSSVSIIDTPPSLDIADIIPDSYHFDSIQSCLLISRYWMLHVTLSGPIQTLYQNFPAECTKSRLPPLSVAQQTDINGAMELARCIRYSFTICPSIPLVPLRVYTNFHVSIGTWYRMIRRLTANNRVSPPDPESPEAAYLAAQLTFARRMENFVSIESNDTHQVWKVQRVNKKYLRAAAVDMAGGPISTLR